MARARKKVSCDWGFQPQSFHVFSDRGSAGASLSQFESYIVTLLLACLCTPVFAEDLPDGFVYLADTIPDAVIDLRYHSTKNFVGDQIDGYLKPKCILTKQAASALAKVADQLRPLGLRLKIFDAYRPQRAVDHFARWAADLDDTRKKSEYYPDVPKSRLFERGYIAARSGHSRGSTVDLTIVDAEAVELDMGSPFDFFGVASHFDHQQLSGQQRANRLLLKSLMEHHGFKSYSKEWCHFTLKKEPFPETYHDFPVQ